MTFSWASGHWALSKSPESKVKCQKAIVISPHTPHLTGVGILQTWLKWGFCVG
ncbi:MAG: hypothetical protein RMX68_014560 [Aulosira sp. ZfuVER01]|nr:hypothetical protein [Aulosira sp. ZfuVER01]MDZ7996638.1 hypothetical protein [Aulosira sp. DedVER01a]MDZ8053859.1 hypothetical protein [Aulosira sp. ZfuCHP01]